MTLVVAIIRLLAYVDNQLTSSQQSLAKHVVKGEFCTSIFLMNKVNNRLLILCFIWALFFSSSTVNAQKFEPGIFAGGSNYFGDLNTNTNFSAVQPVGGVFLRYYFDSRFALRLNGGAGWVSFDDAISNDPQQQLRNLSFKSHIYEVSLLSEFYFFEIVEQSRKKNFSPYGFVGFGVFSFKPKAKYNGEWVELRPLGTEGQNISTTAGYGRRPYDLLEFMIPYGGGINI